MLLLLLQDVQTVGDCRTAQLQERRSGVKHLTWLLYPRCRVTQLTHMNPRSSVISLYWDPQISQSGGEAGSWLPDNKNKRDPPTISSATFWIGAEWDVGAAWCVRVHQRCFLLSECIFCSLCFSELRRHTNLGGAVLLELQGCRSLGRWL